MKSVVMIDVNVMLDALLDRPPWNESAWLLLDHFDRGACRGLIAASSVGTLSYLLGRELGPDTSLQIVKGVLDVLEIAPVDEAVIKAAMELGWPDLEDAIIHEAARSAGASMIITRDQRFLRDAALRAATVDEFLQTLTPGD